MRVIGLTGKAGAGKTFLAQRVLVPRGYLPLCLAGQMKARLAAEGVIPPDEATGREPKSGRTRRILQFYGTELGRDRYHKEIWCSALEWWMSWFLEHGYEKFVIGDVRFSNEVEWITSMGGPVFRITGRGGLSGKAAKHSSETEIDNLALPEIDNSPGRELYEVSEDILDAITDHYNTWPEPTRLL